MTWSGTSPPSEYNYRISMEYKLPPYYLLLQQYLDSLTHNSDRLNFIPCEIDITSTTFSDTKKITYEIQLHPAGNKIGFNLLGDEYF